VERLIGVLGGTFDPPHAGHLLLAKRAHKALKLDKVLWVVTPSPPHKLNMSISPLSARIKMVEQSIHSLPAFELSNADISRPAPHYAVGTLHWLRDHYPGRKFAYLMGSDSLMDLPNWHDPIKFINLCEILAVMHRIGTMVNMEELEKGLPGITSKTFFLEGVQDEISAFDIRKRVRKGEAYDELVPANVAEIIEHLGLYT
jgi:nicotinate-nucleotide adenylyltransferase